MAKHIFLPSYQIFKMARTVMQALRHTSKDIYRGLVQNRNKICCYLLNAAAKREQASTIESRGAKADKRK